MSAVGRPIAVLGGIAPYRRAWLRADVVAGVTLAAIAIPEVMGYTKIAGTPVVTGLYTILLPPLAFAVLGSSRHLVVGGDSATAAIMYAGIAGLGIAGLHPGSEHWLALASMIALVCGGLLLLARLVRLGFLADFISRTVLVGFLTGVGVQVAIGQVDAMLGVPAPNVGTHYFGRALVKLWDTLKEIDQTSLATLAVSLSVIALLVIFDRWIKEIPGGLVVVIGAIVASYALDLSSDGVSTIGPVPSGLPPLGLPSGITWHNVAGVLATGGSIFLVIIAQSAATSRAFAFKHHERFNEDDDIVGLSVANAAAGLTGTFVVNGSPTKTAVVDDARGHTQLAQITMAVTVAIVLLFLTEPLKYLPNAALASVVFVVGIKLVDIKSLRSIWRLARDEFAVAVTTAIVVVVVGVEQGIALAVVLSVLLHVRRHYLPADTVLSVDAHGDPHSTPVKRGEVSEPGLVIYRFAVGLFYANSSRLMAEALMLVATPQPPRWFVLMADAIDDLDYTAGTTLETLADELKRRRIVFAIAEPNEHVRAELDRFGITDRIGADHVYDSLADARRAFHRSSAYGGGDGD
jgi:SulP family sulfate permease